MINKDNELLGEAYQRILESFATVKPQADKGTRTFFISNEDIQKLNLVQAIAFALNVPALVKDPNFNPGGNQALLKIKQYPELAKQDPSLTKAVASCEQYLREYFNGSFDINESKIEALDKSPYFGICAYEGVKGVVSTVGTGATGNPFYNNIYKVVNTLHPDAASDFNFSSTDLTRGLNYLLTRALIPVKDASKLQGNVPQQAPAQQQAPSQAPAQQQAPTPQRAV